MSQRFYSTNKSSSTARQFYYIQMPTISPGLLNGRRNNSHNIFERQQKQLQKSLSRQQGNMTKNINKMAKNNSKGSIAESLDKNKKSLKSINDNVQKQHKKQEFNNQQYLKGNLLFTKFEFKILSYLCQVLIAYALTIGLMYLIKVSDFPFFLILFVFGLMESVYPWSFTNIIVLISCGIITANYFLKIKVLSYPAILICYFSVLLFNQHHKRKIFFVLILVITLIWGFIVIPSLFLQIQLKNSNNSSTFYYIFPIFIFILRVILYAGYSWIRFTQYIFLQLPLFLLGLQYGVMMTVSVSSVEFWYLMVFFTIGIINDRTNFLIDVFKSIIKSFSKVNKLNKSKNKDKDNALDQQQQNLKTLSKKQNQNVVNKNIAILPAHASGYTSINSMHIICIIYVFTKLPIYSSPYTSTTFLSTYIQSEVYLPLVIWGLGLVYQFMCLILERRRKDKLLIGFKNNGIAQTILRGFMLTIGLWMFYLGLGIGNYAILQQLKTS